MKKKLGSLLIPYYFDNGNLYVFLQRRTDDAPINPGLLGGFGGGLEDGESNEEALLRELNEELGYSPKKYSSLGMFETDYSLSEYYIEQVSKNFDKDLTVNEGRWAEWHVAKDIVRRNDVINNVKKAIKLMLTKLGKS